VYVSSVNAAKKDQWKKIGIWYLAGANTCMFSNPKGELDARVMKAQTSNRQLRDDEFMIPARQTKGQNKIKVRVKFIPDNQKLFPGYAFPKESAWSELSYQVYSYVVPKFTLKNKLNINSKKIK
jgi:hypothetical protein